MDRASFELTEDDIEALRARIGSSGLATNAPPPRQGMTDESHVFEAWRVCEICLSCVVSVSRGVDCHHIMQAKHPCALSHFSEFVSLLRGKRLAVFLDYDGAGNVHDYRILSPLSKIFPQLHLRDTDAHRS